MGVVHLHIHTPYSFLDGGSSIETLVRRAASLGMTSLAMTDRDSVAAAVKFVALAHAYGIHPILGAELTMEDGVRDRRRLKGEPDVPTVASSPVTDARYSLAEQVEVFSRATPGHTRGFIGPERLRQLVAMAAEIGREREARASSSPRASRRAIWPT